MIRTGVYTGEQIVALTCFIDSICLLIAWVSFKSESATLSRSFRRPASLFASKMICWIDSDIWKECDSWLCKTDSNSSTLLKRCQNWMRTLVLTVKHKTHSRTVFYISITSTLFDTSHTQHPQRFWNQLFMDKSIANLLLFGNAMLSLFFVRFSPTFCRKVGVGCFISDERQIKRQV